MGKVLTRSNRAVGERVSRKSSRTDTVGYMVLNAAFSATAARPGTGVAAFLVHTRLRHRAIAIAYTLGPTEWRLARVPG